MMSQTHLLICAAALTRRNKPAQNVAVLVGAVIPDISIFIMMIYARVNEVQNLWRAPNGLYWIEPWQTFSAIQNSFPLYIVLSGLAIFVMKYGRKLNWSATATGVLYAMSSVVLFFALSAMIHLICDIPVHADDAHVHFWPFTAWRFHSPISYWDGRHYGDIVRYFEISLGVGSAIILWRRFPQWWARSLAVVPALVVPGLFIVMRAIRVSIF